MSLLGYLEDTRKNALTHITRITKIRRSEFMGIDAATRRNLELTEPLARFDGSKKNTLLYVLDKTETAMGGRLLRKWIERPLQIEEQINERLNAVEAISDAAREREVLAAALSDVRRHRTLVQQNCIRNGHPKRLSFTVLNACCIALDLCCRKQLCLFKTSVACRTH